MVQAQFPRLKDEMRYEEEGDRKIILRLMMHIYNFQTVNIGINIILNSFMNKNTGYYEYTDGIADDINTFCGYNN